MFKHIISIAALLCVPSLPALARGSATVVRFHSEAIAPGSRIALKSADPALAQSLEFASYANQMGAAFERLGFLPSSSEAPAALTAEIAYSQRAVQLPPRRSPFSIGIGVGGGSGNVGVGGSANIPIGDAKTGLVAQETTLSVQIKRADGQNIWEGRAATEALTGPDGTLSVVMPKLIDVLLRDFPGVSGKTLKLKLDSKKKIK